MSLLLIGIRQCSDSTCSIEHSKRLSWYVTVPSGDVLLIMVSAHNRLELASKVLESAADLEQILSSNTGSNLANVAEVIQLSATYLMYRITLVCLKSS